MIVPVAATAAAVTRSSILNGNGFMDRDRPPKCQQLTVLVAVNRIERMTYRPGRSRRSPRPEYAGRARAAAPELADKSAELSAIGLAVRAGQLPAALLRSENRLDKPLVHSEHPHFLQRCGGRATLGCDAFAQHVDRVGALMGQLRGAPEGRNREPARLVGRHAHRLPGRLQGPDAVEPLHRTAARARGDRIQHALVLAP